MDRLILQYLNDTIRLEQAAFETLQANLLVARAHLDANLGKFYNESTRKLKQEINLIIDSAMVDGKVLPLSDYYEVGLSQGYEYTAKKGGFPSTSAFFNFTPSLNLRAISFVESQYAQIIKGLSQSMSTDILRQVQAGIAQGDGITTIKKNVLGTGLRGLKGRDGIFRTASNRAATIARTVTNDVLNRAAVDTYQQLNKEFPELGLKKQWITTSDRRTSARCISLANQIRELDKPFEADDGWTGHNAPAHPNCRSRVVSIPSDIDDVEPPPKRPGKRPAKRARKTPPKATPKATREATVTAAKQAATQRKVDLSKDPGRQALQWHMVEQQNLKARIADLEANNVDLKVAKELLKEVKESNKPDFIKTLEINVYRQQIADTLLADEVFNANFKPFITHLENETPRLIKAKAHRAKVEQIVLSEHDLSAKQFARRLEPAYSLMGDKVKLDKLKFKLDDERAYTNITKAVNVGVQSDKENVTRVLFHEIGHHLEFDNPAVKEASQRFIKRKATGPVQPLNDIMGVDYYGKDEVAYPDHFVVPYAGKIYKSGWTEITSIGVENLSTKEKAVNFYLDHPDHFWHMVGVLEL